MPNLSLSVSRGPSKIPYNRYSVKFFLSPLEREYVENFQIVTLPSAILELLKKAYHRRERSAMQRTKCHVFLVPIIAISTDVHSLHPVSLSIGTDEQIMPKCRSTVEKKIAETQ